MPARAIVLPNAGISRCQNVGLLKGRAQTLREDQRRHVLFALGFAGRLADGGAALLVTRVRRLEGSYALLANPSYRRSLTPASESAFRAAPPLPQPSAKDALCARRTSSATEQ